MDILAIAALEAFDVPPEPEKPVGGLPPLPESTSSKSAIAGIESKAEPAAEVSADDIDPSLASEAPSQALPLPPPPPPRMSASLASILSSASTATSEQPAQASTSSPYRSSVPLPVADMSSPTASASSDVTMVYYGPPERLSEDSGLIRCICPYDDDDGFTIQCERCFAWLHGLCVDISPETVPDIYTCPLCVSGGRIARHVEARAARLQQLRKQAEDTLRRQRVKSNATTASFASSGPPSDPAVPTSELDEEYELLARARGLAYQQSFDSTFSPSNTTYPIHPPQNSTAKPTQSPYYQREQLPVQQHTLGPSPFLHPPPPQAVSLVGGPVGQQQPQHQARRAGSVASNASNNSGAANNNKRSKSGSPGGANLPAATTTTANSPANQAPTKPKKRSSHASQPSLPPIPQNSVLGSPAVGAAAQGGSAASEGGLSAPPPPKKRRSANTKEKDANEVPASILTPTSGSIVNNAAVPPPPQVTTTSTVPSKEATASIPSQPARKTRLATASITASVETSLSTAAPSTIKAPAASVPATFIPPAPPSAGPSSGMKDAFMSDDEDSGMEDRFEPWQFEYTPINYLRYAERGVEQAVNELVEQYVEEERENLNGNAGIDSDDRTGTAGSSRASPFGQHSRHSSARPSLLGTSSYLPALAQASRMTSPVPSSGSSTPAYSSSGVASALAPPCLPLILPEPPVSPSDFSSKLSVKPLATSSMSLAPPACTPFSGPTCVPSLMNPYPRPTIHGVFTSTPFTAGTLITFMNGEVVSGEQYRDDPINQWHDLGAMKCHTRGISQPWDLVLDQRRFADESRFIRNGCHPNVFTKPVIVRKSRNNETLGKKGRTAAKRKADQQKAVQEGGEFELVFGLYALQDIAKREELVLPFDWADDHVVHSLHTLLFSPSLVFPTIPSNVESETEDDGVPSTSSYTHLTASQKGQIAKCTKHLYRLSRLASQTCLILLGTSICACEKRRDCSIAWLWKLACFSESSSARSRGTIQLQDFDLNGLRVACASALATDDKDWGATPGVNGRMSHKKSSRKRRADLGALIGLARGWEKPVVEPMSAIPPRLTSEEEAEVEEQLEDSHMQMDETVLPAETSTPTVERPSLDFGDSAQADYGGIDSVPTSAELEKADVQFQFAPPELTEQATLQSSAPIREVESKQETSSLAVPQKEAKEAPTPSPLSTRPNTAQSTASETVKADARPTSAVQAEDSDSDITEPLPSDHSDAEETIKKPIRKSPVKEMAKSLKLDKRKAANEGESKPSRASPSRQDDMQVDEEEIVRPPKKKKMLRQLESGKGTKSKSLLKNKKVEEEEPKTPAKKVLKQKMKSGKASDGSAMKDKSVFGSGLPSFRTIKEVLDKAKLNAAAKEQESTSKPVETAQVTLSKPAEDKAGATPGQAHASLPSTAAPASKSELDSLWDMPVEEAPIQAKSQVLESNIPAADAVKAQSGPVELSEATEKADVADSDAMQIDNTVPFEGSLPQPVVESTVDVVPKPAAEDSTTEPDKPPAAETIAEEEKPMAPPVRRVSFQAYKKRVFTAPASTISQSGIVEEPSDMAASVSGSASPEKQSPALSLNAELRGEPVLGGSIVQTPISEKTQSEAEEKTRKPEGALPASAEASPATRDSSLPAGSAKPRLSFAAYRQRATTAPKQTTSPAASLLPLPATPPIAKAAVLETVPVSAPSLSMETTKPVVEAPQIVKSEAGAAADTASGAADTSSAKISNDASMKVEDEQEEGELYVDPNLEPGEVEMETAPAAVQPESALGMRMGDLQQPEPRSTAQSSKPSYTPPSRLRSLTPPKPVLARRIEESANGPDSSTRQVRPVTADSAAATRRPSFSDANPNVASSNANWGSLKDRAVSPVMDRSALGPPSESSRYSASGASPPSHPRAFGRGSPRNGFTQPLPGSKPPTGPRSSTAPWPPRGRANSTSAPAGRGGDPIYGGGFGTAGSGGSSYRPGGAGAGGRGDGPPPPRPSQPPSGPRALQGGSGFPSRGRGSRHDAPRDRGWGPRGRGRARGGGYFRD